MQEPNNEFTQPTHPKPGMDDDAPTQPNPALDETMPTRTGQSQGIEETLPTRVQSQSSAPVQAGAEERTVATAVSAKEPTLPVTPSGLPPAPKKGKRVRWPWVILGILSSISSVGSLGMT